MKRPTNTPLHQELEAAGAKPKDATQLTQLATGLTRLKAAGPQLVTPKPSHRIWRWPVWPSVATALGGVVAGVVVVSLAQTSLPGNWLYPVKRASEAVAIQIQPDYRGVVMMRRAQEVRELVGQNGSPELVATTLHDYSTEAIAYKAQTSQNYAAFRYCQSNLQQAAGQAQGSERQAITATLASLPADIN